MREEVVSQGSSPSAQETARYNRVLEHYAGADPTEIDLVGLLAYALYKRQKREWLVRFRDDHDGRVPAREEVAAFTSGYLTDDLRQTLRNRASDMLNDYAETFVEAAEPRIREDAIALDALRQARDIEQSILKKSGLWPSVWSGILATALWTLLVTTLIVAGVLFGSDLVDAWKSVAGMPA